MTDPRYSNRPIETHCRYCGKRYDPDKPAARRTKEHVIPKSLEILAGRAAGVIEACSQCNSTRRNLTPPELRSRAETLRSSAEALEEMADRIDEICTEQGLRPPWEFQ